jgi:hypothetical protein
LVYIFILCLYHVVAHNLRETVNVMVLITRQINKIMSVVLVQPYITPHVTFVSDYADAYVISSMCVSHINVWHNRNLQM